MSVDTILAALALPAETRVEQRVPKKLLLEQGLPTTADKRLIQNGIEELQWVAALKPNNVGVPVYHDEAHDYVEIAVLVMRLRTAAKATRLMELLHRAIPYPVVLLTELDEANAGSVLSLAHKRLAQNEADKVVLETLYQTAPLGLNPAHPHEATFLGQLAIAARPAKDLFMLYQGWIDQVLALAAAQITETYVLAAERSPALREGLDAHTRLTRELALLRAQVVKEKQMNRRVELNLEIKRLEADLRAVQKQLGGKDLL